jgi:hypothetical protein
MHFIDFIYFIGCFDFMHFMDFMKYLVFLDFFHFIVAFFIVLARIYDGSESGSKKQLFVVLGRIGLHGNSLYLKQQIPFSY